MGCLGLFFGLSSEFFEEEKIYYYTSLEASVLRFAVLCTESHLLNLVLLVNLLINKEHSTFFTGYLFFGGVDWTFSEQLTNNIDSFRLFLTVKCLWKV